MVASQFDWTTALMVLGLLVAMVCVFLYARSGRRSNGLYAKPSPPPKACRQLEGPARCNWQNAWRRPRHAQSSVCQGYQCDRTT
jgi:hypothetical protein